MLHPEKSIVQNLGVIQHYIVTVHGSILLERHIENSYV